MRTRISYKTAESVRTMKAYIIDCMIEDDIRDYDNNIIIDCGSIHFSKRTVHSAYIEDILEGYEALYTRYGSNIA